ncbi:glycoside hydrolase family 16 protein [Streptomyces sp. NPDC001709]
MRTASRVAALMMVGMVSLACSAQDTAPHGSTHGSLPSAQRSVPGSGRLSDGIGGIVQDAITPSGAQPGTAVAATVKLHAPECITVRKVGVAVQDGLENRLDYPGTVENARICPGAFTFTTQPRTFRAGTYTQYAYYEDETGYHPLEKSRFQVVSMGRNVDPSQGRKLAWAEEFNSPITWGERWTRNASSAYEYGTHNPRYFKLDWVNPDNVRVADGMATFTARPGRRTLENGLQAWETGLITTEWSREGFRLRPGDYIEARVKLPTAVGAWPSVWTWVGDGHEIDLFEYHPDAPDLLEMANHVREAANYDAIGPPGKEDWMRIGVLVGTHSADWYVNGALVYEDGRGVDPNWSAYLNVNLSISAGTFHPAPKTSDPITFSADYVHVFR